VQPLFPYQQQCQPDQVRVMLPVDQRDIEPLAGAAASGRPGAASLARPPVSGGGLSAACGMRSTLTSTHDRQIGCRPAYRSQTRASRSLRPNTPNTIHHGKAMACSQS
jgi:hypothetical protein